MTEEYFRYTVKPGSASLITHKTAPDTACILYAESPEHHLKLYAGQDGIIEFYVNPPNDCADIAELVIQCGETRSLLQLRASTHETAEHPFHTPYHRHHVGKVRPALSEHEAKNLANEELLKRGYPHRPDSAPAGVFERWNQMVSKPTTLVEFKTVSRPDIGSGYKMKASKGVQEGFETTGNWSGFELRGSPSTYDWVSGIWNVPRVSGESGKHTYSSLWVGLDGDGVVDLVQAGTGHENYNFKLSNFTWSVSIYYAWTEFLPQQQTAQQIANWSVQPGDEIFVEVYIANAGGMPNLSGYFGQFFITNSRTGQGGWLYTERGSTMVTGSEAVWIMERPTVSGSLADLANYGSATMSHAYARRTDRKYVDYQGDTNFQISMVNGTNVLSTVAAVDATTMQFTWKAFT